MTGSNQNKIYALLKIKLIFLTKYAIISISVSWDNSSPQHPCWGYPTTHCYGRKTEQTENPTMKTTGCVYCITNTVNGKKYIGQTIQEPEKRIRRHFTTKQRSYLSRAVREYGKSAFLYEIVEDNIPHEHLAARERYWVAHLDTMSPNGYNLTSGGERVKIVSANTRKKLSDALKGEKNPNYGKIRSHEHRRRLSEANTGKTHTPESRRKISESKKGENNPNYGKPRSPETRQKMSESHKGKKLTAEHRQKLSESHTGKTLSVEHRQKISEANKGQVPWIKGKKLSPESRRKISESLKQCHANKKRA